jgi:hypothetical protein
MAISGASMSRNFRRVNDGCNRGFVAVWYDWTGISASPACISWFVVDLTFSCTQEYGFNLRGAFAHRVNQLGGNYLSEGKGSSCPFVTFVIKEITPCTGKSWRRHAA